MPLIEFSSETARLLCVSVTHHCLYAVSEFPKCVVPVDDEAASRFTVCSSVMSIGDLE